MSEFRAGEIVDITIKGAVVVNSYSTHHGDKDTGTVLVVRCSTEGADRGAAVNLDWPGVSVEWAAPANWPPQQGDVWRDRKGGHWFAYYFGGITMVGEGGSQVRADRLLETGAPLTLVYRRESDGDQS